MKYEKRYALGGGFGGCENKDWEECYAETKDEAWSEAYEDAKEEYESYGGMHGLANYEDIKEENPDYTDEEIQEEIDEDMESWLEYEIKVWRPPNYSSFHLAILGQCNYFCNASIFALQLSNA